MAERSLVEVDLLVVGAGMAGLTAGAYASKMGLRVGVLEKAPEIGGTALLSAGGLLKPTTADALIRANPGGDAQFAELLYSRFDDGVAWIESLGVHVTPPAYAEDAIGIPCHMRGIDIGHYLTLCRVEIEGSGGWVSRSTHVETLLVEDGAVVGATVSVGPDALEIRARHTLLATGGFQGSAALRAKYLGASAAHMLLRSNPHSTGDGLTLGIAAGGVKTSVMDYFYGHTIPYPLAKPFRPQEFTRLAMPYMVSRSLLLDSEGQRFVDESATYCFDARAVLRQPTSRALLVGDMALREADAAGFTANKTLGIELVDRLADAKAFGAHVCEAETLEALEHTVAQWGYRNVEAGVMAFNHAMRLSAETTPARRKYRREYCAPFFAIEVQPVISFTFGGLLVDPKSRVLGAGRAPIPGLLAAGADVGGFFCEQYCSGLTMALTLGIQAVETALASTQARMP